MPVAAGTTTQTLEYVLEDDTTQSLEHTACRAVYTSQGLTVSVSAFSTGEQLGTFTPGEAQAFVEQVVGQSLNTGVVLSGLSAPQDGTDTALEFAQWAEAEYETLFREWADGYGADVIEPQVTKPDGSYRTQDLSLEQVKALWGGEFPWVNGHDSFQNPRAYTYHTEEGEPVYAVIEIGGGDVGFTVTILPQYPQGEWGEALTAVLAQANEEVNGVPVLTSGTQLSTAAYTKYEALFRPQSSDSVIHVEAHAGDTQSDFSPEDAQTFVEQVVTEATANGVDLTALDAQPAGDSGESVESGSLAFAQVPAEDYTDLGFTYASLSTALGLPTGQSFYADRPDHGADRGTLAAARPPGGTAWTLGMALPSRWTPSTPMRKRPSWWTCWWLCSAGAPRKWKTGGAFSPSTCCPRRPRGIGRPCPKP